MPRISVFFPLICVFMAWTALGQDDQAGHMPRRESDDQAGHMPRRESNEVDRIESQPKNSIVYFKRAASKPLTLPVIDVSVLGSLRPVDSSDPSYTIAHGRPCSAKATIANECKQDLALLVFRTAGDAVDYYTDPGKILDARSHEMVSDSRAFYGHCLNKYKDDILLFFQRDRVDRRHGFQSSVLIVEQAEHRLESQSDKLVPHLHETLLERHLPRIDEALKHARKKECVEIPARNRVMALHPPDVNLKHAAALNDEDQDEEPDSPDSPN